MTAYVANHEKKNRIFEKRVRKLVNVIKNGHSDEEVSVAAEQVREAKMNVFKCVYTKNKINQPNTFSPDKLAGENAKIREWLSMSTADIIDMYRPKNS